MKKGLFEIRKNHEITSSIYLMELFGDTSGITTPGQFVNIELDGLFLRRPVSVCDWDEDKLTIIYKVVGRGTSQMSKIKPGEKLDILTGLGNGYDMGSSGKEPLLIGGGAGIPPLYSLAKRLVADDKHPKAILGFNTSAEVFLADEFIKLGVETVITTADGSKGIKGFVTNAIPESGYSYFYTCGPEAMLKAVYDKTSTSGQFSFEERMGCGFGACMGCTCKTRYKSMLICKDGPVIVKEAIIW